MKITDNDIVLNNGTSVRDRYFSGQDTLVEQLEIDSRYKWYLITGDDYEMIVFDKGGGTVLTGVIAQRYKTKVCQRRYIVFDAYRSFTRRAININVIDTKELKYAATECERFETDKFPGYAVLEYNNKSILSLNRGCEIQPPGTFAGDVLTPNYILFTGKTICLYDLRKDCVAEINGKKMEADAETVSMTDSRDTFWFLLGDRPQILVRCSSKNRYVPEYIKCDFVENNKCRGIRALSGDSVMLKGKPAGMNIVVDGKAIFPAWASIETTNIFRCQDKVYILDHKYNILETLTDAKKKFIGNGIFILGKYEDGKCDIWHVTSEKIEKISDTPYSDILIQEFSGDSVRETFTIYFGDKGNGIYDAYIERSEPIEVTNIIEERLCLILETRLKDGSPSYKIVLKTSITDYLTPLSEILYLPDHVVDIYHFFSPNTYLCKLSDGKFCVARLNYHDIKVFGPYDRVTTNERSIIGTKGKEVYFISGTFERRVK